MGVNQLRGEWEPISWEWSGGMVLGGSVDEVGEQSVHGGKGGSEWGLWSIEREKTAERGCINEVNGGWEKMKVSLDSGAIDWVTNKETGKAFKIRETETSKAGLGYRAANGTKIENYGERVVEGFTEGWEPVAVAMQIAEVNKTLGSAFRMNQCGNVIVLDGENSYFVNKATGKKTRMYQENGQFVFNIWTKAPGKDVDNERGVTRRVPVKIKNRFEALGENDDVAMDFIGQDKGRK